jgi:hypothetical protein
MNTLAISNHLAMRLLQGQNTKRVVASKMNIVENKKNNTQNKTEDHSEDRGDHVSIQIANMGDQGEDIASSSSSVPIPTPTPISTPTPAPYNIHQKATNTLDTENILNDDKNKTKDEINTDIVINL